MIVLTFLLGTLLQALPAQTATGTVVQLALKKVTVTKQPQPFAGEMTMGRSGRLEPLVGRAAPGQGQTFWLFEVEFENSSAAAIQITGTNLNIGTGGDLIPSWQFNTVAYLPYGSSSWVLPAKTRKTQKFLAEVPEGTQHLEFTYEGARPLKITAR